MKQSNNGIGFLGFLTLILIGLKLAEVGVVATWSWCLVLAPMWVPLAVAGMIIALTLMIGWRPR